MRKYENLRNNKKNIISNAKMDLANLDTISSESLRVSNISKNAAKIISDIDTEFEKITKLDSIDISFLFFATALQCVRQYWLSNDKLRFKNDQQADKVVKKFSPISLYGPVPYDAFKKEGFVGNTGVSGANHRYTTLGHDPLLGWIFGTANILSETVTKNNFILESYNTILIGNEYKIDRITNIASVFIDSGIRVQDDYRDLILAVGRHAIHLSSDAFTKMGLPIPIINSISPNLSSKLLKNGIDSYSLGRGVAMSSLINMIIAAIHRLFYDESKYSSRDLYEIKTRKILSYSNTIASSSNILYVAFTKDLKKLDLGGLLVTLYRVVNDSKFKKDIKQEFLAKEFHNIVIGEKYSF